MSNPADADPRRLDTLIAIMKALRAPGTGCPWDLEQSFETIAPFTIEEAYEVADAIARGDRLDLREELGDLLLQVVYHAQLADEQGDFAFDDVVEAINAKMVRRHPHVFGDDKARSAKLAKGFWEAIKSAEKPAKISVLDGVPVALPGLTRAVKLQAKAAKVGFDWPDIGPVLAKVREEIGELEAALQFHTNAVNYAKVTGVSKQEEELGDLLFVLANLARHLGIDPEAAIRAANAKFERRFQHIEARLKLRCVSPENSTLAEMDALWDEAKAKGL